MDEGREAAGVSWRLDRDGKTLLKGGVPDLRLGAISSQVMFVRA